MPSWLDCYDYANRVELLGIGRWGSKKSRPKWTAAELSPILVEVALDRSAEFIQRAKALALTCGSPERGREHAAAEILSAPRLVGLPDIKDGI